MARLSQGKTGDSFSRSFHEDLSKRLEDIGKSETGYTKESDTEAGRELNTETLRALVYNSVMATLRRLRGKS